MNPISGRDWPTLWDEAHPSETIDESADLEAEIPTLPTIDHLPPLVDYSTRGEGDWVVSGPLQPSGGNGRYFPAELEAYIFCCNKYGRQRVSRWEGGKHRWAMLIKRV